MYNKVYLLGHLTEEPKFDKNNDKELLIKLAVQSDFKNKDGVYLVDFIPCVLYKNVAIKVMKYCRKDDLITICGSIRAQNKIEIVVHKVSFLTAKQILDDEDLNFEYDAGK